MYNFANFCPFQYISQIMICFEHWVCFLWEKVKSDDCNIMSKNNFKKWFAG